MIDALLENRFLVLPSPEGLPMIEQRLKEVQSAIGS